MSAFRIRPRPFARLKPFPCMSLCVVVATVVATVVPCGAWAGSPLYLTVERSFSPTEAPEVRLDAQGALEPVRIRVLKPKDVDVFLSGQLHIARSYEEPIATLNPGHYIAKGANRIDSPLEKLRRAFSPAFRTALLKEFKAPLKAPVRGRVATVPNEVVIRAPKGFDLVRESFVDLQNSSSDLGDSAPGFDDGGGYGSGDGYVQKVLALEALPDGLYLIQAVRGTIEAQALLQVSALSVQVKRSSAQALVRVMDRALKPVAGAKVSVRGNDGAWRALAGTTDAQGEFIARQDKEFDERLVFRVHAEGKGSALVDTEFLPVKTTPLSTFLFTDRPIFKPGEEVNVKGIVRGIETAALPDATRLAPMLKEPLPISLTGQGGKTAGRVQSRGLTPHGTFSGTVRLDGSAEPGLYTVEARVGSVPYLGELRVRDYVKPKFYLAISQDSGTFRPGQTFKFKIKATQYAGGPAGGARYEVYAYRKKYEAPSFVEDAGGGLGTGPDYSGKVTSAAGLSQPQRIYSSVETRASATAPSDESVPSPEDSESVTAQPESPSGTSSGTGASGYAGSWKTAPAFNAQGEAEVEVTLPTLKASDAIQEEWIYTLMVRAMDAGGSQAVTTKTFYATLSEASVAAEFTSPVAAPGAKSATLILQSSLPEGGPAAQARGEIQLNLETRESRGGKTRRRETIAFETDARGFARVEVPVPDEDGRLSAVAKLVSFGGRPLGQPFSASPATLLVSGTEGAAIVDNADLELYAPIKALAPGETARIFALLPAGWGEQAKEHGQIYETTAGRELHATRAVRVSGRSRWFDVVAKSEYGTGFYHTISVPMQGGRLAEKTVSFRIVKKDRLLAVRITPEKAVAEPETPVKVAFEVKDAQGAPAADVELGVSVVDRAVYAVQSEFRPSLFDFFFPLPRLNLMSFLSDELQGFGYGDRIRKPNFRMGALKSQSTLAKATFRDTAGWFPHVVTDARGRAEITVDLPGNLTEWLVTAVAADKNGRLGEATASFRSTSDITASAQTAQFMRQGDTLDFPVEFANKTAQSTRVNLSVHAEKGLALEGSAKGPLELPLAGNTSASQVFRLNAVAAGHAGTFLLHGTGQGGGRLGGSGAFAVNLLPSAMREIFFASGTTGANASDNARAIANAELVLRVPEAGSVRELRVLGTVGLLGAALEASRYLATYPYGCTEQLIHSTVPNLVLLDVFKKARVGDDALGPYGDVFRQAPMHASAGLAKLIANQKDSGGFGMWPGDPQPSVGATIIALYGLTMAREVGFKQAAGPARKALAWLEKQDLGERFAARGTVHPDQSYEVAALVAVDALPANAAAAFVDAVRARAEASPDELISALKVIAKARGPRFSKPALEAFSQAKPQLVGRLVTALDQFSSGAYETSAAQLVDTSERGFVAAAPSLLSASAGVLADLGALPAALESRITTELLAARHDSIWGSTFDTAQVIYNARALLARDAARATDGAHIGGSAVALADGTRLGGFTRVPGGFSARFTSEDLKRAAERGALSRVIVSGLPGATSLSAIADTALPLTHVAAVNTGLKTECLYAVVRAGRAQAFTPELGALNVGDVVVSRVRVKADPGARGALLPSRYVVVEDPVPSFATPVDDARDILADASVTPDPNTAGQIAQVLRHPDRTVHVLKAHSSLVDVEILNAWRVRFRGKAALPAATAVDMYNERIRGRTASFPMIDVGEAR